LPGGRGGGGRRGGYPFTPTNKDKKGNSSGGRGKLSGSLLISGKGVDCYGRQKKGTNPGFFSDKEKEGGRAVALLHKRGGKFQKRERETMGPWPFYHIHTAKKKERRLTRLVALDQEKKGIKRMKKDGLSPGTTYLSQRERREVVPAGERKREEGNVGRKKKEERSAFSV